MTDDPEKKIPTSVPSCDVDRVSAAEKSTGDTPSSGEKPWPGGEACELAPIGLAWIEGDQVRRINEHAAKVLRESVGKDGSAWRLWLLAAVRRLEDACRQREIVTASRARNRSLEITLGPELPDQGGCMICIRDATAEVLADSEKSETIATLSHELRTPLTSIRNSVGLVLSGEAGTMNTHQERFLNMTMRNIERLERLITDLLDASRAAAGKLEMHRKQVDLGPLLRETLEVFSISGKEKDITIDYGSLPDSFPAFVDGDKVVQIVHNIVGNALKFTGEQGFIRIWLRGRRDRLPQLAELLVDEYSVPLRTFTLVVEDNGMGMSRESLAQVFEPFERGVAAERKHVPGSGLGLHITRGLVEAQGGDIELDSVPGLGTTVSIVLPRDLQSEQVLLATRTMEDAVSAAVKPSADPNQNFSLVSLDVRRADGTPPNGDLVAAGMTVRRFIQRLEHERHQQPGKKSISSRSSTTDATTTDGEREGPGFEAVVPGFWLAVVSDPAGLDDAWDIQRQSAELPSLLADSQWEIIPLAAYTEQELIT